MATAVIRVSPEAHAKIKQLADQHRRTIAVTVDLLLDDYTAARDLLIADRLGVDPSAAGPPTGDTAGLVSPVPGPAVSPPTCPPHPRSIAGFCPDCGQPTNQEEP